LFTTSAARRDRRLVLWHFYDVQNTLAFNVRSGVRSMNESFPSERAARTFGRMISGFGTFSVVLTTGSKPQYTVKKRFEDNVRDKISGGHFGQAAMSVKRKKLVSR
jgi:hypothetical protein